MAKAMYDIFISHKSEDYPHARAVFEFLVANRLSPFLSELSLPQMGKTEFQKQIERALQASRHLLVVTSAAENVTASWVESEWRAFVSEKLSGRKKGNILTVLFGGMMIDDLPLTLRYYEALRWDEEGKRRLLKYLTSEEPDGPLIPQSAGRAVPTCPRPHYFVNSLGNRLVQMATRKPSGPGRPPGPDLYVGTHCVTNKDYLAFVQDGGPEPHANPPQTGPVSWKGRQPDEAVLDHPVIWVTHAAARQFCEWLTNRERAQGAISADDKYALPMFSQWKRFSQGALITPWTVLERSWTAGQCEPTQPVWWGGPNPLGLVGIFGNAFEWCQDTKEETVKKRYRDGAIKEEKEVCYLAVGGGWATSRPWLEGHIGVWCPGGWAMKDGGFRICFLSGEKT